MDDRRRYVRISENLEVGYKVLQGFSKSRSGSIDISRGGIRLPVDQDLAVGTVLDLDIRSISPPISLRAVVRVVWANACGSGVEVGLRFIHMDPKDYNTFKDIIDKLEKGGLGDVGWVDKDA